MRNKIIIIMLLILCMTTLLAGCSQSGLYDNYDKDGYSVSVRYDANGGLFANTKDVYISDIYSVNDFTATEGKVNIPLTEPADEARGEDGVDYSTATLSNYVLAGWYKTVTPVVDSEGNALDHSGNKVADSGKAPAYTYSDKWNFDTDKLEVAVDGEYSANKPVLTLYAAWVPYFTYEFMAPTYTATGDIATDNDGNTIWESIGTKIFDPTGTKTKLNMPSVNKAGLVVNNDVPKVAGKTFDCMYADSACTTEWTASSSHTGSIDREHAAAVNPVMQVYTTWLDGTHVYISEPDQFVKSFNLKYNYHVLNDLDFEGEAWPTKFTNSTFEGTFDGNGYTISNIAALQNTVDVEIKFGGLFGTIGANATITDVNFVNVSYTVVAGCKLPGASFGLLAGIAEEGATISDVTISGSLIIEEGVMNVGTSGYYTFNLAIAENSSSAVIDTTNITCPNNDSYEFVIGAAGQVSVAAK